MKIIKKRNLMYIQHKSETILKNIWFHKSETILKNIWFLTILCKISFFCTGNKKTWSLFWFRYVALYWLATRGRLKTVCTIFNETLIFNIWLIIALISSYPAAVFQFRVTLGVMNSNKMFFFVKMQFFCLFLCISYLRLYKNSELQTQNVMLYVIYVIREYSSCCSVRISHFPWWT